MKINHWIKGGTTLATGSTYNGSINGLGNHDGAAYTVANNLDNTGYYYVAGRYDGSHVEFSGSRSQVETNIQLVTGIKPSIPKESGHGGRTFFGGSTNSNNSDYYDGTGVMHNPYSASILD